MTAPGHNSGGFLRLPTPPSTNNLFVNVPGKGRVKSKRYATWWRAAQNEALTQPRWKVDGLVIMDITVERRDGRSDITNRQKAVEDFLVAHGYMDDDRNVWEARIRWAAKGTMDGCEVRVWPAMESAA